MTRDAPSTSSPELAVPGPTLRGVRLVIVSPDEAVLQRGLAEVRLVLPGLATILQLLSELADGTRDEERLVAAFPTDEQPQIQRLLIGLRSRGILHTVANPDPADLFWLSVARLAPDGAARLAASSVAVIGVGPVAEALTHALQSCGVGAVIGCASDGVTSGSINDGVTMAHEIGHFAGRAASSFRCGLPTCSSGWVR